MKTFNEMYPEELTSEKPAIGVQEVVNLFSNNEIYPGENEIKAVASAHKIDDEAIEAEIFRLLHSFLAFGRSNDKNKPITLVNDQYVEQLEKGIIVEYEHTTNYHIAKKIAKDHLAEIPDYYDRLERMERSARIELGLPMEDDESESYE